MKNSNQRNQRSSINEFKQLISQINSKVVEVLIELDFSENVENSHEPFSTTLLPAEKASFTYTCINRSCTKKFYDFTEFLDDAIRGNKKIVEGRISCDGWQDKQRIGQNQCLSMVNFKITVSYND
jgi:hypothetical protein